jgi:peptidoglycan/xylan/chitin deacetylase (PgdA/CDA1 family)
MPFIAFFIAFLLTVPCMAQELSSQEIQADKNAVHILAYGGIDTQEQSPYNISADITAVQFENHLNILKKGGYNVLPLPEVIDAFHNNKNLPRKSVAITFDMGAQSVATLAQPLLERYDFPFTVFIDPKADGEEFLSHQDIVKMDKSPLINFGLMAQKPTLISDSANQDLQKKINNNTDRFYKLLEYRPQILSFQDGLYNEQDLALSKRYGFRAILGQHAGVAHKKQIKNILPRFVLTKNLSQAAQFESLLNARAFPVKDMTPNASVIDTPSPAIGFTVDEEIENIEQLSCFAGEQKKPEITVINNRVEIRLASLISAPSLRVNCIIPIIDTQNPKTPYYRWLGIFLSPQKDQIDAQKQLQ